MGIQNKLKAFSGEILLVFAIILGVYYFAGTKAVITNKNLIKIFVIVVVYLYIFYKKHLYINLINPTKRRYGLEVQNTLFGPRLQGEIGNCKIKIHPRIGGVIAHPLLHTLVTTINGNPLLGNFSVSTKGILSGFFKPDKDYSEYFSKTFIDTFDVKFNNPLPQLLGYKKENIDEKNYVQYIKRIFDETTQHKLLHLASNTKFKLSSDLISTSFSFKGLEDDNYKLSEAIDTILHIAENSTAADNIELAVKPAQ